MYPSCCCIPRYNNEVPQYHARLNWVLRITPVHSRSTEAWVRLFHRMQLSFKWIFTIFLRIKRVVTDTTSGFDFQRIMRDLWLKKGGKFLKTSEVPKLSCENFPWNIVQRYVLGTDAKKNLSIWTADLKIYLTNCGIKFAYAFPHLLHWWNTRVQQYLSQIFFASHSNVTFGIELSLYSVSIDKNDEE